MIQVRPEVITVASKEWPDLEYRKQSSLDFKTENPYLYVAMSCITNNAHDAYGEEISGLLAHSLGFMYKVLRNQFEINQMEKI